MSFKISLSVHQLVDFVLRSGDIDTRIFNNATMLEGTHIHRYYQAKMDSNYQSEVLLSTSFDYEEFTIEIEGRADGIIEREDYVIVDEIKSCVGDLVEFHEKNENWHLGQAKVYAYLYCKNKGFDKANVVLTYISQEDRNNTEKYFYTYKFKELEYFFFELVKEYISYQKLIQKHKQDLKNNIKNLKFPFKSLNLHQKELIEFVNEIEHTDKQRALIEAPTGIGKTVSVLYPSLLNFKKYDRIFYLTAKNSGKEIVDDTVVSLIDNKLGLKSVVLSCS